MNAPLRSSNWRNLAADTADARELRRWVTTMRGKGAAQNAVEWLMEHRGDLPQLKTGIHPRAQLEMIQCGRGVDGIPSHYDASLTTQMVTEDEGPDSD